MPAGLTPRVLVVGAGFGGLTLAQALKDGRFAVEVVDRRNHHLFQPLLYQVATAGLEPADIAYAVRGITRRFAAVRFTGGEVVGGDLGRRVVQLADGAEVGYDYLVLAGGSVTATFGVPGVAEHAFGLKSLEDAIALRQHLLARFERTARAAARPPGRGSRAATQDHAAEEEGGCGKAAAHQLSPGVTASRGGGTPHGSELSVVVVGGGPTGVEMAGAVSELYSRVLRADFPELDLSVARVHLVEMAEDLLGSFHPSLRAHAAEELRRRGVQLHLGAAVEEVTAGGARLAGGELLPASTVVWASGVEAVGLGKLLGLATERAGRITVEPDLSVLGHPEVFAIGDLAAAKDPRGTLLPQLSPVAMQQARHVAAELARREAGRPGRPFRYTDKGTMATIGRQAAVAQLPLVPLKGRSGLPGPRLTGTLAWLAWLGLHIWFLIGFRNRLSVLLNWAWNYVTWDRAARVIVGPLEPAAAPGGPGDASAA